MQPKALLHCCLKRRSDVDAARTVVDADDYVLEALQLQNYVTAKNSDCSRQISSLVKQSFAHHFVGKLNSRLTRLRFNNEERWPHLSQEFCAIPCQLIHLEDDGTSFLQVVLCYQLHSPLPARTMHFVPSRTRAHTYTQTNGHAHCGLRGTDTCRVFVTSSLGICDRAASWERQPSGVGRAGLEGGNRA